MRCSSALAALVLSACAPARADPPPPWRALAPGLRWMELRESFADEAGTPRAHAWVIARLDLRVRPLTVTRLRSARLMELADDPRALLVVNAGFFEPDHRPSGLLRVGARTLGEPAPRGGSGVLVVRDGRATLLARESLDGGALAPSELALQCGPRLVETDGRAGVHRDDGRRFARTVACLRDGGRTLDLIATWRLDAPMSGPGLRDLALRLTRGDLSAPAGCEAALNLDGGPSTGVFARDQGRRWRYTHPAQGPTPWVLVARR